MKKSIYISAAFLVLVSLLAMGAYSRKAEAKAPPQQYPMVDRLAGKIVQKYQSASCEQLWEKKSQKTPPGPEEQRVIQALHNDAQMRAAFMNQVAAPIANKLFECGMIP